MCRHASNYIIWFYDKYGCIFTSMKLHKLKDSKQINLRGLLRGCQISIMVLFCEKSLTAFPKENFSIIDIWQSPHKRLSLADNYMLKFNNRNTRTRGEICSNLIMKIPERRQWHHSGIFIVNFEHISHLVLVFLLLTLNR